MKDWDNYYSKHCTRMYGWLPASLALKKRKGTEQIKYLTLCDTKAIDIFMLEKEGVLSRASNKTLADVTICEMDEGKVAEIFKNVNPPWRDAIVTGKIQKLILFEDTPELRKNADDRDVKDYDLRKTLKLRRDALRLQQGFPFDIINFDPCDSIINPDSEMFAAFDKLFQLQQNKDEFLIFATTPVKWNAGILKLFTKDFKENIQTHESIKQTAKKVLNVTEFTKIADEHKKAAIGFGKALVAKLALKYGFVSDQLGIHMYTSGNGTLMLSSVTRLYKSDIAGQDWYPAEISKIIKGMPTYYDTEAAKRNRKVVAHLKEVVEHRDAIQKQFSA